MNLELNMTQLDTKAVLLPLRDIGLFGVSDITFGEIKQRETPSFRLLFEVSSVTASFEMATWDLVWGGGPLGSECHSLSHKPQVKCLWLSLKNMVSNEGWRLYIPMHFILYSTLFCILSIYLIAGKIKIQNQIFHTERGSTSKTDIGLSGSFLWFFVRNHWFFCI